MSVKQIQKRSSAKENTAKSAPAPRKSRKPNFRQFTEARYRRMSDEEFVTAFEEDNEVASDMNYTPMRKQFASFFMANISREDREELQELLEIEDANLVEWLESYPELIERFPNNFLWKLQSDELLSLLIHHPEKADLIIPMLHEEDIWALKLPCYCPALRRIGVKLCPWETMTTSQIRYMKLKSAPLKKFIETHKLG